MESVHLDTGATIYIQCSHLSRVGGGGTCKQAGYHPHKDFQNTPCETFSGLKIDPKYLFLHMFFLFCQSCPFQYYVC